MGELDYQQFVLELDFRILENYGMWDIPYSGKFSRGAIFHGLRGYHENKNRENSASTTCISIAPCLPVHAGAVKIFLGALRGDSTKFCTAKISRYTMYKLFFLLMAQMHLACALFWGCTTLDGYGT